MGLSHSSGGRAGVQESPRGGASGMDAQSNSASRKEQWAEDSDEDAPDPRMWFEGTSKGARWALSVYCLR